ncbi:hypothetical protein PybrP1_007520 [[Pythium] brassicae (nom. inval.)]|nr:hypothetical protein PybrP1_007520 [[Pythium] brassicae (nom. inval.)]
MAIHSKLAQDEVEGDGDINILDLTTDIEVETRDMQEIKRLVSTTNDPERKASLEEQLRELELASVQAEQLTVDAASSAPAKDASGQRRKSFRPTSAKPRMLLSALSEDHEVHSTSTTFANLDAYRQENGPSLVAEVLSSSFDDQFPASSVLTNDQCTFWMSSGMFPQFLRLVLREPMPITAVEISCCHVKKLKIRSSRSRRTSLTLGTVDPKTPLAPTATEFEVPSSDGSSQSTHRIPLAGISGDVEVVEIVIESGYSDFVCVYFVHLRLADPPAASDADDGGNDDNDSQAKR